MTDDQAIARAMRLDTATLSDALDRWGIVGQCEGISPRADDFRIAGRAFTIRCGPAATPPGSVGDYIDDVPPGTVIAIDNGGRVDATIWGDILTEVARQRGIGGTVIDGICRDVQLCRDLNYPVFSKGHWMRTGKDRVQVVETECVVDLGGARVAPGDLLVGDADGLVVIPQEHEDRVLQTAEAIGEREQRIRDAVRGGARLDEARERFGYHSLQRRERAPHG